MNFYRLNSRYTTKALALDGVILTKNEWKKLDRLLVIPLHLSNFIDCKDSGNEKQALKKVAKTKLKTKSKRSDIDDIITSSPLYDKEELEGMSEEELRDIKNSLDSETEIPDGVE